MRQQGDQSAKPTQTQSIGEMLTDVVEAERAQAETLVGGDNPTKSSVHHSATTLQTDTLFTGNSRGEKANGVTALKEWTGKAITTIIYDSTVDVFTGNELFNKLNGKPNIAVVGFTTDGDVFGGFYSRAVDIINFGFRDPTIFAFSFESHGRCMTPQRFVVKAERTVDVSVILHSNSFNGFVEFWVGGVAGEGGFKLGNEKSRSNCRDMSKTFEAIEDTTLSGKNGPFNKGPYHHCARLVAVQLT